LLIIKKNKGKRFSQKLELQEELRTVKNGSAQETDETLLAR
jgi:hypothetical protein